MEAPDAIKWLNDLGVEFDKAEDGTMVTTHGGGTSRKRMHAAKDYSGSEIMRTIRDEVLNLKIPVVEFTSAVELLKDEKGQVAGAVLLNMETGDYSVARAKTVVIATGGAGRISGRRNFCEGLCADGGLQSDLRKEEKRGQTLIVRCFSLFIRLHKIHTIYCASRN